MYPIGIPLLYAIVLWKNRHFLNPTVQADVGLGVEDRGRTRTFSRRNITSDEDLKERLRKRRENPDLVPSMFLWKDFGERWFLFRSLTRRGLLLYIFEVSETRGFPASVYRV